MPPDEKFGEMDLSWPETVLYIPQPQSFPRMDSREFNETDTREGQDAPSPIYTRRLNDDEFRLLYLPAVDDESHPIHASLEAYQIDDCPEYETVSYCWGGEDGDATLCKPVFLGDYWDVLLQTNNCWSMLRYLRPRTGIRVVWVDAICIHQKDHQERESQVTMMGSIYERCLRAVVYLGEDAVRPQSNDNRTYPARRDLGKVSAAAVDLHQVLKMRYFQRVWVIQELIRAPMVVIPVRGVELIAGRRSATLEQVAWHETNAPWMGHICTGRPDPALRRILEQTKNSQSTDPRDKVFGLLGFLPERQKLRPNYLLSSLHIYVGTIAHMLLNEGHSHILVEAAGFKAPSTIASWLPDGNLSTIGELLGKVSNSISRDHAHSRSALVKEFWAEALELNPDWEIILLAKTDELRYGRHEEGFKALEVTTALPPPGRPSVHPSTSALSLPLIYLWRSSSIPIKIRQVGDSGCAYEMKASSCTFYICTSDTSLDTVIGPEPTSVFLLKDGDNAPFLLFMRRPHPDGSYRLIKCCSCFGIFLSRKPPFESSLPSSKPRGPLIDDFPARGTKRLRDQDVPFSRNFMPILYRTVYQVISKIDLLCQESWETLQRIATIDDPLDSGTIASHIMSLFQRLANGPKPPFVDLYFNLLRQCCPDCCVEVRVHENEALVFVTMDPKEWLTVHESLNRDWYGNVFGELWGRVLDHPGPWYWARVSGSSDTSHTEGLDKWEIDLELTTHELSSWVTTAPGWNHGRDPAHSWFNSPRVTMVTKAEGLREWLRTSDYFKHFPELRACSRLVNEDEIALATTAPKPEYSTIGVYGWPESCFDGEHIPGKVENISIF